ncbi:hypothetical protein Tco_0227279 [Tanacetum coccineum]
MEWQRQSVEDLAVRQMMRTQVLEARARIDMVATLTGGMVRREPIGHDAGYAMTWGTLKEEGNDVAAYTQCFQELALICTKFLADETKKVNKYISGLTLITLHGIVMSARPKLLIVASELANVDGSEIRTYAERAE